jgi:D-alanyl-D-alanine carboxypeptidase
MDERDESSEKYQNETPLRYVPTPVHVPVVRQLSIALGLLILIFGTTYVDDLLALAGRDSSSVPAADIEALVPDEETANVPTTDYFDGTAITARSAYVWDLTQQRALYNKNADVELPLASLTKLMTALVAYELLDPDDRINISVDAINEMGDSGFFDGERFSLRNLTDITLITSSNDGAYALAAAAGDSLLAGKNATEMFVRAMNIRAEEIGLSQTHFNNATGLDLSEFEGGAYGSARDMAFLMEYIITHYPGLLEGTVTNYTLIANENGEGHLTENTNEIVSQIDGIIASKTGYTDLAGGNLVVAFNAGLNRPIIVSVLGSTRNGRFNDIMELVDRARMSVLNSN